MNVQSLSRSSKTLSIDEFFDWIETKDEKYELVDGKPVLQPWVKRNHNRIVINIVQSLGQALDGSRFEIATGDFAISTGPRSVRYADVMIEAAGGSGQERTTDTAALIVEVLSPSTADVDFGPKQREYLGLSTLDTYLIVAQDSRCIWQWTRDEAGSWPDKALVVEEGAVELKALDASLPLDEIYRNVS
ncbi:Uma2 family endonuclease [Aureimonas leprariae]|nr:Uma2 family endonuclease [Aureimonas leprariae]